MGGVKNKESVYVISMIQKGHRHSDKCQGFHLPVLILFNHKDLTIYLRYSGVDDTILRQVKNLNNSNARLTSFTILKCEEEKPSVVCLNKTPFDNLLVVYVEYFSNYNTVPTHVSNNRNYITLAQNVGGVYNSPK
jgi:hypothetical protein